MDQKETNATLTPETIFSDRSVILKLLAFLGQLPGPQDPHNEGHEQISLPILHSK
jgi:hypothetical protein